MDKKKRAVIVGMAIGDGYVQVRTRERQGYKYESRSMRVVHGASQRAYCEFKAKRLGWALGGRQINVYEIRNGPGGRYKGYHFTVSHRYFGQVRRWLYPNGQKTFTDRVLDMLNPEGLAYWYLDDGHARKNVNKDGWVSSVATDIATMCSEQEARLIVDWFDREYGIPWKVRCMKGRPEKHAFFVQCNTKASHEFASVIGPYVPECMKYKLAHVAAAKLHERQTPVGVCGDCGTEIYERRRKCLCAKCYTRRRGR